MIYIGITKVSEYIDAVCSLLPENALERVNKTKNEKERALRAFAYALLSQMSEELLCKAELDFTKQRPAFSGLDFDFNISHDYPYAVVAISDVRGEKVGVDIQAERCMAESARRIEARFFKDIDGSFFENQKSKEISVRLYSFNGKAFESKEVKHTPCEEKDNFFYRWTRLESLLKAFGGGFADYSGIDKISRTMSAYTFQIDNIKDCFISVGFNNL